ncbi:MAG: tyrosine-protein phosphatase, partial [Pseudorhodoplanes sp.]
MADSFEAARVLPLERVHNFRDYGGYPISGGARVRAKYLWRSGQHFDATESDLESIHALRLATVIDLRSDSERRMAPCRRHPEFAAQVLSASGEGHVRPPHVAAARIVSTVAEAHEAMQRTYRRLPFGAGLLDGLRLYFRALTADAGASLVHCFAGKDRTGIAAAMLHHVLGVHEDDILEDYLLTNTAGDVEARIADGAATIRHPV